MTVNLCVSLWPRTGCEAALVSYEDDVLALLVDHGGRTVARARLVGSADPGAGPYETQLIAFDSEDGLAAYMADERRTALAAVRDAAIERTDVQRVEFV